MFNNVPKGQVAKKEDWQKAFNTEDINKVIEEVSAIISLHPGAAVSEHTRCGLCESYK